MSKSEGATKKTTANSANGASASSASANGASNASGNGGTNSGTVKGTNKYGNHYTARADRSYTYNNPTSKYHHTGKGHAFFDQKETPNSEAYRWHENQNQGIRTYNLRSKKSKK